MARWDNYFPILQLGAMDDKEFETKLLEGIGTPELWRLRRNTAMAVGRFFHVAGDALLLTVDPKLANHQQIIAFSMLLRMDGELTRASIPSPGTIQLTLPKLLQLILRFGSLVVGRSLEPKSWLKS